MAATAANKMEIVARTVRVDFGDLPQTPTTDPAGGEEGGSSSSSSSSSLTPFNWYDGSAALTEIFHALSVTFPVGETFFIDSVMHYAPRLKKDHPELWKEVQLFFKQEGMHTAVHEAWNARIQREFGHPMRAIEAMVDDGLKELRRRTPFLSQLAVTACLEHWTAGLGHVLLCTDAGDQLLSKCAEPYRSLWAWHALEEIEHKSVAFDVYRAMGGGYFRRTFIMIITSLSFLYNVVRVWWHLAITRRKMPAWASLKALAYFTLWSPGVLGKFLPHLLAWFRPGYHPSQHYSHAEEAPHRRHSAALDAKALPARRVHQLLRARRGGASGATAAEDDDLIAAAGGPDASVIFLQPSPAPTSSAVADSTREEEEEEEEEGDGAPMRARI